MQSSFPPSANLHFNQRCNMRCKYCFATFEDVAKILPKGWLPKDSQLELTRRLSEAFAKVTFAGGEPTLLSWLPELVRAAKDQGATTMVVTNGSKLGPEYLALFHGRLDWIALSIDSALPEVNRRIGRVFGSRVFGAEDYLRIGRDVLTAGIRLKVNVVVSSANCDEDFRPVLRALRPQRVKFLQVLPVGGQNDEHVRKFVISRAQFNTFVRRHAELEAEGIQIAPEANEDMTGSYAMVDPAGRFFDNATGRHRYSDPILQVGIEKAWSQVAFSRERFDRRGGLYDWSNKSVPRLICLTGVSGSGKDEVAKVLVNELGYMRVALADPLKALLMLAFGLGNTQLWGDGRNVVDPVLTTTPRAAFQKLGDAFRALDPEIWIRLWRSRVEALLERHVPVVCSDVRTPAELAAAKALGGQVWKIVRTGAGAPGPAASHATETLLHDASDALFDRRLVNDSTLEDLAAAVRLAIRA